MRGRVYATAKKAGFDVRVMKAEDDKPTYFGLLLVE